MRHTNNLNNYSNNNRKKLIRRDRRLNHLYNLFIKKYGCKDCKNKNLHKCCYQFDHIDGSNKANRKYVGLSEAAMLANYKLFFKELRKCDIICANCHAIRTYIKKQIKGRPKLY